MMLELTPLEAYALEKLLQGDDEVLKALRAQLHAADSIKRRLTGAGFFLDFGLPKALTPLPDSPTFRLGDVHADIVGLHYGAGFILLVENGLLSQLEGFSYEEPWPQQIQQFDLHYIPGPTRDLKQLRASILNAS